VPPREPLEFYGKLTQHLSGVISGIVWYTGVLLAWVCVSVPEDIQAPDLTRFMLLQGSPLVASLWGMLVFKEFKQSDIRVKIMGALMIVMFLCGLAMIGLSPMYLRKD